MTPDADNHVKLPSTVTRLGDSDTIEADEYCQVSPDCAFFVYCRSLLSIELHSNITYIADRTFQGSYLQNLTFPEMDLGLSHLRQTFSRTPLRFVDMSKVTIRDIGERAFYSCDFLEQIILPSELEEIGAFSFFF